VSCVVLVVEHLMELEDDLDRSLDHWLEVPVVGFDCLESLGDLVVHQLGSLV
jgi:hypothetical protein